MGVFTHTLVLPKFLSGSALCISLPFCQTYVSICIYMPKCGLAWIRGNPALRRLHQKPSERSGTTPGPAVNASDAESSTDFESTCDKPMLARNCNLLAYAVKALSQSKIIFSEHATSDRAFDQPTRLASTPFISSKQLLIVSPHTNDKQRCTELFGISVISSAADQTT